jgi:preprotein translocase subunit SecY
VIENTDESGVRAGKPFDNLPIQRIAITLGALLIYHFATFVPLPGVDPNVSANFFTNDRANLPFQRVSGFMLGTVPMFSALILAEFIMLFSTTVRQWQHDPKTATRFQRCLLAVALLLSAVQAWGLASGLEDIKSGLVIEPGTAFRISTAVSMMAATCLIALLANFITKHGVGNGFWLLFLTPVLANAPAQVSTQLSAATSGAIPVAGLLIPIALVTATAISLVALERASPGLAASEGLIWPPILAGVVAVWMLTPMLLLYPEAIEGASQATAPRHIMLLVAQAVLIPALTLWRIQCLSETGSTTLKIGSPVTVAFVLTAIVMSADAALAWSGMTALPDGQSLVIVVSVALSVLAAVRTAKPNAA